MNGNLVAGKSSVEPVDDEFQQRRCSVYVDVVLPQLIQSHLVSAFVATKLPAHAYHQLQYRHEVWAAHIGA